jgi:hypothetical protein
MASGRKSKRSSFVPLEFPLSPMRVFARRTKRPFDVPVQRPHDDDARHHGRPIEIDDQEQGFYHGLPLIEILFGLRQAGDLVVGIAQSHKLTPTR